jgi:hypothetical protein
MNFWATVVSGAGAVLICSLKGASGVGIGAKLFLAGMTGMCSFGLVGHFCHNRIYSNLRMWSRRFFALKVEIFETGRIGLSGSLGGPLQKAIPTRTANNATV